MWSAFPLLLVCAPLVSMSRASTDLSISVREYPLSHCPAVESPTAVSTDWFFRILVTSLFAVAIWLLAMPWVPAIAQCTMHRFHLRTGSFAAWAVQQPIPPMYSFANTTEVCDQLPDHTLSSRGVDHRGMINHFPTRVFTWASGRATHLRDGASKWFVLRSAYRGHGVDSVYRLDRSRDGGWTVSLVEGDAS